MKLDFTRKNAILKKYFIGIKSIKMQTFGWRLLDLDGFSLMTFWAQYGEFIKLALIFVAIIILLKFKIPLSGAIGIGAVLTVALYGIPVLDSLMIAGKSMISEATIMVLLNCYLITFLPALQQPPGQCVNRSGFYRVTAVARRYFYRRFHGRHRLWGLH